MIVLQRTPAKRQTAPTSAGSRPQSSTCPVPAGATWRVAALAADLRAAVIVRSTGSVMTRASYPSSRHQATATRAGVRTTVGHS